MGRFQLPGGVPRWTTSLLRSVGGSSRVRQAVGWIRPLQFGRSAAGHPPDRSPSILNGDLRPLRRRVTGGVKEGPPEPAVEGTSADVPSQFHLESFAGKNSRSRRVRLGRSCGSGDIETLHAHQARTVTAVYGSFVRGGQASPTSSRGGNRYDVRDVSSAHGQQTAGKSKNEKAATISQ